MTGACRDRVSTTWTVLITAGWLVIWNPAMIKPETPPNRNKRCPILGHIKGVDDFIPNINFCTNKVLPSSTINKSRLVPENTGLNKCSAGNLI